MNLEQIQIAIGYKFNDSRLLVQSLVHRSYINEREKYVEVTEHNERLEFLGDAVLELIVTEYLYVNFQEPEGFLTSLRAALVNYRTIGEVGNNLGLDTEILLSSGEKAELGRARLTIVADCMEAVIGAMYLDGGLSPCVDFVKQFILIKLEEVIANQSYRDDKSLLQEFSQKFYKLTPRYKVVSSEGKDHEKVFRISVVLGREMIAEGTGRSKQEAETEAASNALNILRKRENVGN